MTQSLLSHIKRGEVEEVIVTSGSCLLATSPELTAAATRPRESRGLHVSSGEAFVYFSSTQ